MANVTPTITRLNTVGDNCHVVTWANMLNGDIGIAIEMPGSSDRSVQLSGTFGVGGSMSFLGSNDGSNFIVLTDPQGNAITKTAAMIEQIEELTRYVKPQITAGDGTTSLTVSLLVKRGYLA